MPRPALAALAVLLVLHATGNILRIDRFDAPAIPGPLGITLVRPGKGKVGTTLDPYDTVLTTAGTSLSLDLAIERWQDIWHGATGPKLPPPSPRADVSSPP